MLKVWTGELAGSLLLGGVYTTTLGVLAPGASQTVTFTVSFTGTGSEVWTFIDPDHLIAESNEGNNLAVRWLEVEEGSDNRQRLYLPLVLRNYLS